MDTGYSVKDSSPFSGCTNLQNIVFAEGTTTIPNNLFHDATYLKAIQLPASIKTIGVRAFGGCYSLEGITLPEGLESIKEYAFTDCTKLTSIVLPKTLTSLSHNAFSGCTGFTEVTIPSTLKTIEVGYSGENQRSPFYGCTNLKKVVFEEGTTEVPAFILNNASSVSEIIIPDTVTAIKGSAFGDCTALQAITLPKQLKTLQDKVFKGCYSLEGITLPEGLESIKEYAFTDCTKLTSIVLPKTLTSLSHNAFSGCTGFTEVTIPNRLKTIEVGYSGENQRSPFYGCTNLKKAVIETGTAAVPDYLFNACSSLENVTIPSTVAGIGAKAFKDCLTSLVVQGYTGSYAETFATVNKYTFISLGAIDPTVTVVPSYTATPKPSAATPVPSTATPIPSTATPIPSTATPIPSTATPIPSTATPATSKPITLTAPKKVVLKGFKKKTTKKATVTYKKVSGVAGYQIVCATNSKFTKGKIVKTSKKTSYVISGLKKGKTYYVKVRAFKYSTTGKKIYGKFSAKKSLKLK